jgi:hypothetical protein
MIGPVGGAGEQELAGINRVESRPFSRSNAATNL